MNTNEAIKKFGVHLRGLRAEHDISQAQLSFMAEIGLATIKRIENGKIVPKLSTLVAIAVALEIPMSKLMDFNIYDDTNHY